MNEEQATRILQLIEDLSDELQAVEDFVDGNEDFSNLLSVLSRCENYSVKVSFEPTAWLFPGCRKT